MQQKIHEIRKNYVIILKYHTPFTSYHDHNQQVGGEKLFELLREGKNVALVSDAGLPCISDPGADIARKSY